MVLAASFLVPNLQAQDAKRGRELADANACMHYCHNVEEKKIGPSYKQISEKYQRSETATTEISKSIRFGSRGKWGDDVMRPQKYFSDDDLKDIAAWILSLSRQN